MKTRFCDCEVVNTSLEHSPKTYVLEFRTYRCWVQVALTSNGRSCYRSLGCTLEGVSQGEWSTWAYERPGELEIVGGLRPRKLRRLGWVRVIPSKRVTWRQEW